MNIEHRTSNVEHPILYSDIRFIGVGNELRQDDGVGIFIVRHLGLQHLSGVKTVETRRDAAHLIDLWQEAGIVFVFDAVYSGGTAGAVCRLNAVKKPLPADFFRLSTHALAIAEAVELSRVLNRLPVELIFYGIEGKNFGRGQGLSAECRRSALKVIQRVSEEIRNRKTDVTPIHQ
jgi:hydrogenase maturation protease